MQRRVNARRVYEKMPSIFCKDNTQWYDRFLRFQDQKAIIYRRVGFGQFHWRSKLLTRPRSCNRLTDNWLMKNGGKRVFRDST